MRQNNINFMTIKLTLHDKRTGYSLETIVPKFSVEEIQLAKDTFRLLLLNEKKEKKNEIQA